MLLITTSVDKEWNLWADHPTFLPLMNEFLRHTARRAQAGAARHVRVGDPITFSLDAGALDAQVAVRTPSYPNEPDAFITAEVSEDGRGLRVQWENTTTGGVYQFVFRDREGREQIRLVDVNIDPAESDLAGRRGRTPAIPRCDALRMDRRIGRPLRRR